MYSADDTKMAMFPKANGTPASTGLIQCTLDRAVHANQKSLTSENISES